MHEESRKTEEEGCARQTQEPGSRWSAGSREEKERGSRGAQKCRVNMALEWLGIAPGPAVLSKATWWDARQSMRHQLASIYGYIVTGPIPSRPLLASPHARLKHSCQPPSDSTSDCPTAILLAKNYFNLPSHPSPSSHGPPSLPPSLHRRGPRQRARSRPRPGMDLLALFRDLFSPRARRDLWRRVY